MGFRLIAGLRATIAAAGLLMMTACSSPDDAQGGLVHLFMGSTQSTSGVYTFGVAVASVINKHDPGIVVTVVESSGAYDNARRMKEGIFHWSISGSPAVYAEVRRGQGAFQR